MIETRKIILACSCRAEPKALFVFGDNIMRKGKGGQAVIRDEPNAVGIPTKYAPTERPDAYFSNQSMHDLEVVRCIHEAFLQLSEHLKDGGKIVWPIDGVGTGRAKLSTRAPKVLEYINRRYFKLVKLSKRVALEKEQEAYHDIH